MGKGRSEIEFEEYTELQDRRWRGREKNQEIKGVSQILSVCDYIFLIKYRFFLNKGK